MRYVVSSRDRRAQPHSLIPAVSLVPRRKASARDTTAIVLASSAYRVVVDNQHKQRQQRLAEEESVKAALAGL